MSSNGRTLHDTLSYVDKAGEIPSDLHDKYLQFVLDLVDNDREITKKYTSSKQWTDRILKLRKKHKIHPGKAQIKLLYQECLENALIIDRDLNLEKYLTIKPSRSLSGILVIAVSMSPNAVYLDGKTGKVKQQKFSCSNNCYYCPNEAGMPRSYLSQETMIERGIRADFDAIDQFYFRANTLKKLGHNIDKIELVILGGTFCQYPYEYQQQFIRDLYWSSNTFYDGIKEFKLKRARKSLSEEIKIHETATKCHIVGLSIETRPDTIYNFEIIKRFREFGITRIQIGVEHTDDTILKYINRKCYTLDTILAIRLLKNCGFRINMHLMPNLPGSTSKKDISMFNTLLSDDLIQCDEWSIFPCQTVDYSLIKKWYERGLYKPYSIEELINVIINIKSKILPWIRLNRIFRSLPPQNIISGITMSNFRQYIYQKMNKLNLKCKCIRCREIGTHIRRQEASKNIEGYNEIELKEKLSKSAVLKKRQYKSSGGDEIFISLESEDETVLMGFLRLRLPPIYIKKQERNDFGLNDDDDEPFLNGFKCHESGIYGNLDEYKKLIQTFPELYQAALVREVHVYGEKLNIKSKKYLHGFGGDASPISQEEKNNDILRNSNNNLSGHQSRGYGSKLMIEAETIAMNKGYSRIAVISAVGARLYFRLKLGYKSHGTYMVKDFNEAQNNVNKINLSFIKFGGKSSVAICVTLYILSSFLSVTLSILLVIICMTYLDYLHFYKIKYNKSINRSLLILSKMCLISINFAILFNILPVFIGNGSNNNCYCNMFSSLSLVLHVTAFYLLKLIQYKRVLIMIQNPMFGNDAGIKSIPISHCGLLMGQCISFSLHQYIVLNSVTSHCIDQSVFNCYDTSDAILYWIGILSKLFETTLISLFCSRWYGILVFMEEMAHSLLAQISLIMIVIISCIIDAFINLIILYTDNGNLLSYLQHLTFLLTNLIIAICLVLSFTDSQKYIMNKIGIKSLTPYYQSLENLGYNLHIM